MADRRRLLLEFLTDTPAPPLTAEAEGHAMLWSLFLPRVRATYRDVISPWPQDTETLVHTTRVSSRRLVEALRLACPVVGTRRARRGVDRAQGLRRRFGQCREADVVSADLRGLASSCGLDDGATAGLSSMQQLKEEALAQADKSYPPERLIRHALDLLSWTHTKRQSSLRRLGAVHLYRRAQATLPLIDSLVEEDQVAAHHRLRIRFKAIRYTVEILGEAFDDVLDTEVTLTRLKVIQDALGDLNDAQDAGIWLRRKQVKAALTPAVRARLIIAARALQAQRWQHAKNTIMTEAYDIVGQMRRASGKIGLL